EAALQVAVEDLLAALVEDVGHLRVAVEPREFGVVRGLFRESARALQGLGIAPALDGLDHALLALGGGSVAGRRQGEAQSEREDEYTEAQGSGHFVSARQAVLPVLPERAGQCTTQPPSLFP